jgi:hypothetical protein
MKDLGYAHPFVHRLLVDRPLLARWLRRHHPLCYLYLLLSRQTYPEEEHVDLLFVILPVEVVFRGLNAFGGAARARHGFHDLLAHAADIREARNVREVKVEDQEAEDPEGYQETKRIGITGGACLPSLELDPGTWRDTFCVDVQRTHLNLRIEQFLQGLVMVDRLPCSFCIII